MTRIHRDDVLIAVDVQYDFMPGGALAIADGHAVVPLINHLAKRFDRLVATQDWHTPAHESFASSHPGRQPFETIEAYYGPQTLWPDHCVMGTPGAAFHSELDLTEAEVIIRKGYVREIDSYSAFFENDRRTPTGLAGYLHERGLKRVFLAGLAADYCVAYSALDAVTHGFDTTVVLDACRAIDLAGSLQRMLTAMRDAGVRLIDSAELT